MSLSDDSFITNLMVIETDITMEFRLTILIVVVVNSIITYGYERIIVWYVSIWWKNRTDSKVARQQDVEILE
jgi:uncharacterized protein (UPF0333 family)